MLCGGELKVTYCKSLWIRASAKMTKCDEQAGGADAAGCQQAVQVVGPWPVVSLHLLPLSVGRVVGVFLAGHSC